MARKKKGGNKRSIESYEHKDKQRANNPPVGLVTPETDPEAGAKKVYSYDPHLDPQLVWAGKAEHTSFEVPTVSLHVHERIDPRTIIEAVRKRNGDAGGTQLSLFEAERQEPLREVIDFYRHPHGWSNRLVAGDSLLVMNSLLEKEGMAGKVQMFYMDPPYGIKYGSNFQPFVNKRDVKDGKDDDLTSEPEQIRAFRDTWELGIHSYLSYLRDRLLLARELLTESGSIFVQINAENQQLVLSILAEVFGIDNFIANIIFRKKSIPLGAKHLETMHDHILFFAKDKNQLKYRHLYEENDVSSISSHGPYAVFPDDTWKKIDPSEFKSRQHPKGTKYCRLFTLIAPSYSKETDFNYEFQGKVYPPPSGGCWVVSKDKLDILKKRNRLQVEGNSLSYRLFFDDFPYKKITSLWNTIGTSYKKIYAVQTAPAAIAQSMLMTTDPGDLVFDPTCGSGTTAFVAEEWGRRWITCDTSRVALTLARQRLMTAVYDYYELAHPEEGVGSGFKYKTVPHITLKSIANNEPPAVETLYDQPLVDRKKKRVSGPFTVEAVPAPAVKSVEEILEQEPQAADTSIARSGETLRQGEWCDELLRTGIRGKGGQHIRFARLEPLPGCRHLHADGETRPSAEGANRVGEGGTAYSPQRIVVSFGPEDAPLEQRQVAHAIEEAQTLVPKPTLIAFAALQFDSEAAKDIDETKWPGVTLLKVQMNADLLTEDLKKKRASNESFWLIGQPDVELEQIKKGEDKGKWRVQVHGFDYYNTKTGGIESGGEHQIAVWLLDTDYDGRSLYPRQVFFPQAGAREGWARLAKNLKAEIDEDLIQAYRGTVSLPFERGEHQRIAVKIVDDRGIESLKVMEVGE
ncbi:MAG: site-specific DNA-methyltransferase [Deltaproteobacteria bacterium]|nr:site-specific DNA-methyltransferase [Deltaproteobacteria bacterium]